MKVEYTKRAVADLRKVSVDSEPFGQTVATAVDARIREVVKHISENPEATAPVAERPGMRVIPLIRYPFKIFYRIVEDRVRILTPQVVGFTGVAGQLNYVGGYVQGDTNGDRTADFMIEVNAFSLSASDFFL